MVGGECSTHAELTCTCSWLNNRMSRKRSEEHTSELQSRLHLVCRLLLEKKKNRTRSSSARTSRQRTFCSSDSATRRSAARAMSSSQISTLTSTPNTLYIFCISDTHSVWL